MKTNVPSDKMKSGKAVTSPMKDQHKGKSAVNTTAVKRGA